MSDQHINTTQPMAPEQIQELFRKDLIRGITKLDTDELKAIVVFAEALKEKRWPHAADFPESVRQKYLALWEEIGVPALEK